LDGTPASASRARESSVSWSRRSAAAQETPSLSARLGMRVRLSLGRRPQHRLDLRAPGLGDDRRGRRAARDERVEVLVPRGPDADALGAPEGGDARASRRARRKCSKELVVPRIRRRPPRFDVVDAEVVEAARELELVGDCERDAYALAAVAQGGVVDLHVGRDPFLLSQDAYVILSQLSA
jgi:hypothetical protein